MSHIKERGSCVLPILPPPTQWAASSLPCCRAFSSAPHANVAGAWATSGKEHEDMLVICNGIILQLLEKKKSETTNQVHSYKSTNRKKPQE